jgi:hypothetical protein
LISALALIESSEWVIFFTFEGASFADAKARKSCEIAA